MHRIGGWLIVLGLIVSMATHAHAQGLDPQTDPTALVRFVHALPGVEAVDIYLGGNKIVDDLPFGEATDYGFASDGAQMLSVREGDAAADADPLVEVDTDLSSGALYTVAVAGDSAKADGILFQDDVGASGEAFGSLRVINLVPGEGSIAAAVDETAVTELLAYSEGSERLFADRATPTISIFDQDGNEVAAVDTISLAEGELYTLFVLPSEDEAGTQAVTVLSPILMGAVPNLPVWTALELEESEVEATPSPEATSQMQSLGQMLLDRVQATATAEALATQPSEPVTPTDVVTSTESISETQPVSSTAPLLPVTGSGQPNGSIPLWLIVDGLLLIVLVYVGRLWLEMRAS